MKCTLFLQIIGLAFTLNSVFAQGFTDSDLKQLMEKNDHGIIYVWSPNVPLTWKGKKEAKKIAQEAGMSFTDLVDPYGKSPIMKYVPEKVVKSQKLLSLGILEHFPAIIIYKNKKVFKRVIHGHETRLHLLNLIKEVEEISNE